MDGIMERMLADQLGERKRKLEQALSAARDADEITALLRDIDVALEKYSRGRYGLCESCGEPIEAERLMADPLVRYCIEHLNAAEQKALERDIDLAAQIQNALLPKRDMPLPGWEFAYYYRAAGTVSGDYLDLIIPDSAAGSFYFMTGDVTGKGIAASMLMSQLHGSVRTLSHSGLPVHRLVEQANRLFCEGSLSSHFATLVLGSAYDSGRLEICNAGHCSPMLIRGRKVDTISSTGLPLGVICNSPYTAVSHQLQKGDYVVMYTDGLTEARNGSGEQFGEDRLVDLLRAREFVAGDEIISTCVAELAAFTGHGKFMDDLAILALKKK